MITAEAADSLRTGSVLAAPPPRWDAPDKPGVTTLPLLKWAISSVRPAGARWRARRGRRPSGPSESGRRGLAASWGLWRRSEGIPTPEIDREPSLFPSGLVPCQIHIDGL